jgi:hypothetical protein
VNMVQKIVDLIENNTDFTLEGIKFLDSGNGHDVFEITIKDFPPLVARIEKPNVRVAQDGVKRDTHFNGPLSVKRQASLYDLVRVEAGLPAPKVYAISEKSGPPFIITEKMNGVHWREYLEANNYSKQAYLKSLSFFGADLAAVQQVRFSSFGNVIAKNLIESGGISGLENYLHRIIQLKLQRVSEQEAFTIDELDSLKNYFNYTLSIIENEIKVHEQSPVLVLTDLHPMNFYVDEMGKPSGYFDLESCQSGHPALEFYQIGMQFLNYFNDAMFTCAKDAFVSGFEENGGCYDWEHPLNKQVENILCVAHLTGSVGSYKGARDGLRDNWSDNFKEILFDVINTGGMDYVTFAEVLRQKTKQPKHVTLP